MGVLLYSEASPVIAWAPLVLCMALLIVLSGFFSASETAWTTLEDKLDTIDAWLESPAWQDEDQDLDFDEGGWEDYFDPDSTYPQIPGVTPNIKLDFSFMNILKGHMEDAVNEIAENGFNKTLSVLLVGNNVVNIGGGFTLSACVSGDNTEMFLTFITVVPILLFGELAAKKFAERRPVTVAVYTSVVILPVSRTIGFFSEGIAAPVDWILEKCVRRERLKVSTRPAAAGAAQYSKLRSRFQFRLGCPMTVLNAVSD